MIIHRLEGVGWRAVQAWRLVVFQLCYHFFELISFDLMIEFHDYTFLFQFLITLQSITLLLLNICSRCVKNTLPLPLLDMARVLSGRRILIVGGDVW